MRIKLQRGRAGVSILATIKPEILNRSCVIELRSYDGLLRTRIQFPTWVTEPLHTMTNNLFQTMLTRHDLTFTFNLCRTGYANVVQSVAADFKASIEPSHSIRSEVRAGLRSYESAEKKSLLSRTFRAYPQLVRPTDDRRPKR